MARNESSKLAVQFIVQSLATFFGVYFALMLVNFVEKMDIVAVLIGAIVGALGLFISARIILRGIDMKK